MLKNTVMELLFLLIFNDKITFWPLKYKMCIKVTEVWKTRVIKFADSKKECPTSQRQKLSLCNL